tara:strand:+ start:7344 stop:7793 length:450 start_codon:yes stop_codon:yes gene_type:complete
MSFLNTREVLSNYSTTVSELRKWCRQLDLPLAQVELRAALTLVEIELTTRIQTFQAAIEVGDTNALDTFIQYEPHEELHTAIVKLDECKPDSVESLLNCISDFYEAVFVALGECVAAAEATPAKKLFSDLQHEARSGITSLAWNLRGTI